MGKSRFCIHNDEVGDKNAREKEDIGNYGDSPTTLHNRFALLRTEMINKWLISPQLHQCGASRKNFRRRTAGGGRARLKRYRRQKKEKKYLSI